MKDVKQEITEKIIAAMESGKIPWQCPFERQKFPINMYTKHKYTGVNVLILWLEMLIQGYTSHYWLTFKQVNELKGHIKKGEKGCPIIFYKLLERQEKNKDGQDETKFIPIIKYYYVFNLSQVEDINIQTENYNIQELTGFKSLVDSSKAVIQHHGEQAFYNSTDDYINMPFKSKFKDDEGYYSTLSHELIHWTGHKDRLNRLEIKDKQDRAFEELTAEIGASFLCAEYGITPNIENTAAYLQSWLKALKDDNNFIFKASKAATTAFDYIKQLNSTETKAVEEKELCPV